MLFRIVFYCLMRSSVSVTYTKETKSIIIIKKVGFLIRSFKLQSMIDSYKKLVILTKLKAMLYVSLAWPYNPEAQSLENNSQNWPCPIQISTFIIVRALSCFPNPMRMRLGLCTPNSYFHSIDHFILRQILLVRSFTSVPNISVVVKSDIVQVTQLEQLRIQEETKKQYTPGQTISVGRLLSNSQEVGQLPSSALNGKSRLIVSQCRSLDLCFYVRNFLSSLAVI